MREGNKHYNIDEYIDDEILLEVFRNCGIPEPAIEAYYRFIEDTIHEYKTDVDLLDVSSLEITCILLKFYWEQWFSEYFNNDDWSKWLDKFELCAKARNPVAHGHEEFLTNEYKSVVNNFSDIILKQLSDTNACLSRDVEIQLTANKRKAELKKHFYLLDYSLVYEGLKGQTVEAIASCIDNKGLLGYFTICNKHYKCRITKSKWIAKYRNEQIASHLGERFMVQITGVNLPQGTVTVEFA